VQYYSGGEEEIMSDCMIHFCFLKAEKNEEGLRPVISKPIDDLGITLE